MRNTLPNGIHTEVDVKKVEKMREDACKTYFGKDDCLKEEITETCGQKEWDKFRQHFVNLSYKIVSKCDFSRFG